MYKAKQLRDQSQEELEAALLQTRQELFRLKNEIKQTRKLEKPHLLNEKKKDIAKILTILGEKTQATS